MRPTTNRPTTYAKHVGRAAEPEETQLDIFSTAAPTLRKRRARPHRPAAAPVYVEPPLAGWSELAVEAVRLYVATTKPGEQFTFETLRLKIDAGLPLPTDLRAWGNIPRMCVVAGILAKVVGTYAPALSSNGSPKQVYTRGANA